MEQKKGEGEQGKMFPIMISFFLGEREREREREISGEIWLKVAQFRAIYL